MSRRSYAENPGHARPLGLVVFLGLITLVLVVGCGKSSSGGPTASTSAGPTVSGDLNSLLTSGQSALDANNLPQAEQAFRAAVSRDPKSARAQFGLGNVLVREGKLGEAETAYKAALISDPSMSAAHANLGVTYYQMGQLSKAADEFNAALKVSPNDAPTTYLLAAVRLQEDNLAEAERLLLKARDLDANLPEVYYGLGALYKAKGQKADAIAAFEKFLEIGPGQDPQAMDFAKSELRLLKSQP